MTEPRLLPDFAAVPTAAERARDRNLWRTRQTTLALDTDVDGGHDDRCAVCAGDHDTEQCPHGEALTLTEQET